jgi:hypothetical protein
MKKALSLLALAGLLIAPAAYATDIATVREVDEYCYPVYFGYQVTIEGLVKCGNELGSAGPAYIEDNTAGIAFYFWPMPFVTGDYVTLTAWVDFYSGLIELADDPATGDPPTWTVISSGNLVEPNVITIPEMGEENEGKLIKIMCVFFHDAGGTFSYTHTFEDADGNVGTLYVDSSTDVIDQPIPEGWVNITGCHGQYDNEGPDYCQGYQIIPRSMADLEFSPTATDPATWTSVKSLYRQ